MYNSKSKGMRGVTLRLTLKRSTKLLLGWAALLLIGSIALGFFTYLYATVIEPEWVQVTEVKVTLPGLSPEFEGYRVAQLSDMHIDDGTTQEYLDEVIRLTLKKNPDLIVMTGDFLYKHPESFAPVLTAWMAKLTAPDGTYAVLGNHDHWSGPEVVRKAFREAGVMELDNTAVTIHRGGGQLHIAGVDDAYLGLAQIDAVLAQLPDEGPAILLAHEPDFADTYAASGRFGLQLSGHTHGGQVYLPFAGPPALPPHGKKYVRGLYQVGDMLLYTNRGLGTDSLKVRFNARPEITIFILGG